MMIRPFGYAGSWGIPLTHAGSPLIATPSDEGRTCDLGLIGPGTGFYTMGPASGPVEFTQLLIGSQMGHVTRGFMGGWRVQGGNL